jgi:hypothetical protein
VHEESVSRKGAKAQRKEGFLLPFFAPLRLCVRDAFPPSKNVVYLNIIIAVTLASSLGLALGVRDVSARLVGGLRHGDRVGDGVQGLAHLRRRLYADLSLAEFDGG